MPVTRRRSSREEEPEERDDARPTRGRGRGRSASEDMPDEERNSSPRRGRGRASSEEPEEDKPSRGRGRRGSREDAGSAGSRRATSGFGAYSSKKVSTGGFADEFKPGDNNKVLIKLLEEGPFDTYNQHWIDDMPSGERKSYVCRDDEYFGSGKDLDCPLCEIGEGKRTFSLFNIVDFSNPRKPEVKVWAASAAVTDQFERASKEPKTTPLNREDVYFEVELQKKNSKSRQWNVVPVKARDLPDDYDLDPLTEDEIEEFEQDMFDDRTAVTKVDSFEDLDKLADDLTK